jgi:hypothetical protein
MRHLGSIVLSLVLAPLIYLLAGVGLVKFAEANEGGTTLDFVPAVAALGALLLAGVCYAILSMTRLSPLGPTLAGLAFLAAGFWALIDPASLRDRVPPDVLGVEGAALLPAAGLTVLLSVPLLATALSSRRWRRYDPAESPGYGAAYRPPPTPTPVPPGAAVPGFPPTSPAAPEYQPYGATEATTRVYPPTSPAYPPTSPAYPPTSPAYPPTSPAYPPTSPAYPPTSPAYPPTSPASPAYPATEAATPAYPFPSPVSPTWPGSEESTDTAEQTRPLPANPGPNLPPPAAYPPSSGGYPPHPSDPEATRRL